MIWHISREDFPDLYSTPKSREPQRHFTKFTCCACCCPGPNLLMFPRTFNPPKVVSTCGQDHLRLWWRRTDDKRWNDASLANPRVLPALAVRLIMKHSRLIGVGQILWEVNKSNFFSVGGMKHVWPLLQRTKSDSWKIVTSQHFSKPALYWL